MGRNGGQMVSVLAFYSVSTSSNHIRVYSFYSAKLFGGCFRYLKTQVRIQSSATFIAHFIFC